MIMRFFLKLRTPLLLSVLVSICMTSFIACSKKETPYIPENPPPNITYEGNYVATDKSVLLISKADEEYKILLDIFRLTILKDGVGTLHAVNGTMLFSISDLLGNPLSGKICWNTANEVVLEITNSSWNALPIGMTFSFKRSDTPVPNYETYAISDAETLSPKGVLPYADVTYSLLGSSYSTFKAKENVHFELPSSRTPYIRDTIEDGIEYYSIDSYEYIGVQGDTIVADILYRFPADSTLNRLLQQDEFYDTPPRIVQKETNYAYFGWQINNGYLIVCAHRYNDEAWYYCHPECMILLRSLEQCSINW